MTKDVYATASVRIPGCDPWVSGPQPGDNDPGRSLSEVFLQPGELYFGDGRTRVHTLLGSCVSATLWHPQKRMGGMCHYMLPRRGGPQAELDARYAEDAMLLLRHEIRQVGTRPEEYVVKLFGGGSMFPDHVREKAAAKNVSCSNVEAGRVLARKHGFAIHAEDLGGVGYRKVVFDIWSGDVWLHKAGETLPLPVPIWEKNKA